MEVAVGVETPLATGQYATLDRGPHLREDGSDRRPVQAAPGVLPD